MGDNVHIVWVRDHYDGPLNGLAMINDEKLWFKRNNLVPINIDNNHVIEDDPEYSLLRLSPEDLKLVEDNQKDYCAATGEPQHHGDARHKRTTMIKENANDKMVECKVFHHRYIAQDITGELVKVIRESDFDNYYVPHVIE